MKTFTITQDKNVFTLKAGTLQVLTMTQSEFLDLCYACGNIKFENFTSKNTESQEILKLAQKTGEEIYKKYLEIYFNK